jgi:replicative superfamily II helicase
MCGRSGRAGYDPYGESYLIVFENELQKAFELTSAPPESVQSNVGLSDHKLKVCVGGSKVL